MAETESQNEESENDLSDDELEQVAGGTAVFASPKVGLVPPGPCAPPDPCKIEVPPDPCVTGKVRIG